MSESASINISTTNASVDAGVSDLIRAFYEPFRTGDTSVYQDILAAATGRRIAIRTMDMHEVQDGRIVTTWHLEDFAGLIAQLSAPDEAAAVLQGGAWT